MLGVSELTGGILLSAHPRGDRGDGRLRGLQTRMAYSDFEIDRIAMRLVSSWRASAAGRLCKG